MMLKLRHTLALALTSLTLAAPPGAGAQTPQEAPPEALASFPLPPTSSIPRSFTMQLPGAIALLSLPGATPLRALPVVLILQDALGADGRAAPYVETLLGAGIAVLELREASAEAARNAVAALSSDPRLQPSRLGVLGFGEGARIAMDQPGPSVRALLYPGCVSFPHPRKSAAPGSATWRAERIDWKPAPEIRAFIGPIDYAWDFHNPSPARLLPAAKQGEAVLLLHGSEDPANPAEACAALAARLRQQGADIHHREIPAAGYAWDYPAFGTSMEALLPAAGLKQRLPVRPWPTMAAQTAAEVAGFFAQHFHEARR